ncbi:MAG: quinate 5-dehydrogenase [Armatimonadetes bacterium]|nr:quinate 5-dehydrogenase [Armatimonadota bacterium]
MKKVVSVSLGSPARDWQADLSEWGVPLLLERRGVGLNYAAYGEALRELDQDSDVAAIGLGGLNRYLFAGDQRYELRKPAEMAAVVRSKPTCDGARLKQIWEPEVVRRAAAADALTLAGRRALMVCAVDRWGMAEALAAGGAEVVLGDLMFALGVPLPIRGLPQLRRIGKALLPVVTRHVPFEWLYPTGESKEAPRYGSWYRWADLLAGDWKFIGKHMPVESGSLAGKVVVTNTTTARDVEAMRDRGIATLITTTPSLRGRSFGTNLIEAAAAGLTGLPPEQLHLPTLLECFRSLGWDQPRIESLT